MPDIVLSAVCIARLAVADVVSMLLISGAMRLSSVRAACCRSADRLAGVGDRLRQRRVVDQSLAPLSRSRASLTSSSSGSCEIFM